MQQSVDRVIDDAISNKSIVGAEIIASKGGEIVYRRASGYFDREAGIAMPENAIYRLASVTKPIVATTVLRMVDLGLLGLDDPVTKFLPFFTPRTKDGNTPVITIRHLLTHTSGLPWDADVKPSPSLNGLRRSGETMPQPRWG